MAENVKMGRREKMLLILAKLKYEAVRIFGLRRNVIFFIFFGLVGIFLVYSGMVDYKNFQEEKASREKNKANIYGTSNQHEGRGFHVLYEPSPSSLFFNNSSVFEDLYANVDMTGSLKVDSFQKERKLFPGKIFSMDFAGLFFFLGSLFMVYQGMISYKSENYFFRFGNLILRLFILDIFFVGMMTIIHLFPKFLGMFFPPGEVGIFFHFGFYLVCFLSFFYAGGLFFRTISWKIQDAYIYIFIFWIFSAAVVPEIMTIFLPKRIQLLPADEKYNTVKLEDIEQAVRGYERVMQLYPTSFFLFLSGELSSEGYYGYIDLVRYTLPLQQQFREYIKKKNRADDNTITPFVTEEEYIFKASGRLPGSFVTGVCFTLVFTHIFFLASYVVFRKRKQLSAVPAVKKPPYKFRKGNAYFLLCKDEQFKNDLFKSYQAEKNTAAVDNVRSEDIDTGVGLAHMLEYLCKITGVEIEAAVKNLRLLGISDPKKKDWNKETLPEEVVQKLYCAVSLAGDRQMIVVNGFLKGKSREMERQFLNLVTRLTDSGKTLVYLGTEMFSTLSPFDGNIKINDYKGFKIDPQAVSLR